MELITGVQRRTHPSQNCGLFHDKTNGLRSASFREKCFGVVPVPNSRFVEASGYEGRFQWHHHHKCFFQKHQLFPVSSIFAYSLESLCFLLASLLIPSEQLRFSHDIAKNKCASSILDVDPCCFFVANPFAVPKSNNKSSIRPTWCRPNVDT